MRLTIGLVLISFLCLTVTGQDIPVAEAREPRVFYFLDQDTEGLIDLEAVAAKMVTRQKRFGFGGTETVYVMPGAKSPVRLTEGRAGVFVYTADPGTNPYAGVQFYRLDSKKDNRELLNTESVNGRTAPVLNRSLVPFRLMRHGKMSFKVVMQEPLVPGEYGLSWSNSNVAYCFGVERDTRR